MEQYYLYNTPQNEGPFTPEELRERRIGRDTLVLGDKHHQWKKAHEFPELAGLFPPLPTGQSGLFNIKSAFILISVFIIVILSFIGYRVWSDTANKTMQAEKKEQEQQALEYTKSFTRAHIAGLVQVSHSSYAVRFFGGISGLKVSVNNASELMMDMVIVEVRYIKEGGAVFKTETLQFSNIKPHTAQTQHAPESDRGSSAECNITMVKSEAAEL